MKRHGNLYEKICSLENLRLADVNARKGKGYQRQIREHDLNREANLEALRLALVTSSYRTPAYKTFTIYEPKERLVSCLPYIDKVLHHAVLQIIGSIFGAMFTADSYSGIKGKGTHAALDALDDDFSDRVRTMFCLKFDIRKYYPSVDHDVLKAQLRRKFRDKDLLRLLDEIIDSAEGLPIGNYLSMFFSNFYLTGFDHWIKEVKRVRYYMRYMDDFVILGRTSEELHELRCEIAAYLGQELKLTMKDNWQVFPVAARGIDFLGYVSYQTHRLLRKRVKQTCARKLAKNPSLGTVASYLGWMKPCNSRNLQKKLLIHEKFQRLRDNNRIERVHRREDSGKENTESGNRGACLHDQAIDALPGQIVHMASDKAQQ